MQHPAKMMILCNMDWMMVETVMESPVVQMAMAKDGSLFGRPYIKRKLAKGIAKALGDVGRPTSTCTPTSTNSV